MMSSGRADVWFRPIAYTAAVIVIGYALQISNGHLNGEALLLLTFALLALGAGIAAPVFAAVERRGPAILYSLAVAGLGFQLALMFLSAPGIYLKLANPNYYLLYLAGIVAAGCIASLGVCGVRPQVWLPLLVAVHFALGVWMIHASPAPRIDVFYLQNTASNALLHGQDPYTVPYPDIYEASPETESARVPLSRMYGYPPVSYLCAIPGYLAGDVRYSHLTAMSLTALLIAFAQTGAQSAMIAALFLFTPRSMFVVEQAWTEPFALMFLAAALFSKARRHSKLCPIFLGLLIGTKQHMFLVAPAISLLTMDERFRWKGYGRLLGISAAVAGAITLPFVLWDPSAFYRVMTNFWNAAGRADSLSYPSWLSAHGGPHIAVFDVAITAAVMGIPLRLLPRSASGFAAATAFTYFVLFLFSIGSFCNYYYMVLGMLCIAAAFNPISTGDAAPTAASRSASKKY